MKVVGLSVRLLLGIMFLSLATRYIVLSAEVI